jgi:hypothetical protein
MTGATAKNNWGAKIDRALAFVVVVAALLLLVVVWLIVVVLM